MESWVSCCLTKEDMQTKHPEVSSPVCTNFMRIWGRGNSRRQQTEWAWWSTFRKKESEERNECGDEERGILSADSAGGGLVMFVGWKDAGGGQRIDLHLINDERKDAQTNSRRTKKNWTVIKIKFLIWKRCHWSDKTPKKVYFNDTQKSLLIQEKKIHLRKNYYYTSEKHTASLKYKMKKKFL